MKISRRTERLHSPSCGIFVFESLADEFTESDWITFNAEQMPSFCVSSLFWFNIESLTLEIACQTLIGDRKCDYGSAHLFEGKVQMAGKVRNGFS